jgi:ribosome-binding protein aMBF1 (putative translation factor)
MREQRRSRGWKQLDLALKLETDPTCVSRWERGRAAMGVDRFRSLCVLFGASADDALQLRSRKRRSTRRPDGAEAQA